MYYIVGLGNTGDEYAKTRHNVGRMLVEYIACSKVFESNSGTSGATALLEFKKDKVLEAMKLKGEIADESVTLLLPETFMNKSGKSVMPLNLKKPEKLIVIHDDIDLPLGQIKIVFNRGSGGHKGVESVKRAIKTEAFVRVKIGVIPTTPTGKLKKPDSGDKILSFILGEFQKAEFDVLKKTFKKASEAVAVIVSISPTAAMNLFNSK